LTTEVGAEFEGRAADLEALGDAPAPAWFRAVAALVGALPYAALGALGAALGWLAGSVLRIRRAHAEAAMRAAGLDDAPTRAARVYRSLGLGVFELLWTTSRDPRELDARFSFDDAAARDLRAGLARGRGLVVVTAHTGNWDIAACGAARRLVDEGLAPSLTVVTKRLKSRGLDRAWQRLRAERGVTLVGSEGAARACLRALRSGGVVALLVDQAPERGDRTITAPFAGAPARYDLAPALIAARAGAPIAMMFASREPDGQHRMTSAGLVEPAELVGGRAAHEAATRRIAAAVDAFVRAHAEQWLWLHRRWK
jgi:KDO2-lipid IV(A) lauroyltransferase